MGECFIVRRGASTYAAIGVEYPAGSTVTCAGGGVTLTNENTEGFWVFSVPSTGNYTITATDGTNTTTSTVTISAKDEHLYVKIIYHLTIFDGSNGGDNSDVTGGWTSDSSDGGDRSTITSTYLQVQNGAGEDVGSWYGGTSYLTTKREIDCSNFSLATITVTAADSGSTFSVGDNSITINAGGTYSLDISDIDTGIVQITATRPVASWGGFYMRVTKIMFE